MDARCVYRTGKNVFGARLVGVIFCAIFVVLLSPAALADDNASAVHLITLMGVPLDFVFFAFTRLRVYAFGRCALYVAAAVALIVCGIPAALQQQKYSPISRTGRRHVKINMPRVGIVAFILISAVLVKVVVNTRYAAYADHFPFLGATVWLAILLCTPIRQPDWTLLPSTFKGTLFLLSLVLAASMMPVEHLPAASANAVLGLGFASAVFDNISLTALALKQGDYDGGFLAYAVGFGGSMLWFGSSAGVALSNNFPEAKLAWLWLKHGWHVALAYVVGFAVMSAALTWHPTEKTKGGAAAMESIKNEHEVDIAEKKSPKTS